LRRRAQAASVTGERWVLEDLEDLASRASEGWDQKRESLSSLDTTLEALAHHQAQTLG